MISLLGVVIFADGPGASVPALLQGMSGSGAAFGFGGPVPLAGIPDSAGSIEQNGYQRASPYGKESIVPAVLSLRPVGVHSSAVRERAMLLLNLLPIMFSVKCT